MAMTHMRGGVGTGPGVQAYSDALAERKLRFSPEVEREYASYHSTLSRARVRFWQPFLLLLTIGYFIARLVLFHHQVQPFEVIIRLGVLIPAWTALAVLAWSRYYDRLYMPIARILIPITVCLFAMMATMRMAEGRQDVLASLTTTMLGTLFLSGLLFRHALLTGILMVATFLLTALLLNMSMVTIGYASASAFAALVVGAFVYYDIEKTNRRAFLQQSIADRKAHNDALTGLANRRAFDELVPKDWLQAARESRSIALLLIDVDHFKKYNDRYGHQSGDRCLAVVGRCVATFARRPLDIAARLGGEEMAVLLYDANPALAQDLAEKLRQAVQDLNIEHLASSTAAMVTVSVGLAIVNPAFDRSHQGLLQLADEALYEAKQQGRNRVVLKHEHEYEAMQTGVFRRPDVQPR